MYDDVNSLHADALLEFGGHVLLWLRNNISEAWTRSIYASAALGLRERFSFAVLGLFVSLMTGLYIGGLSAAVRAHRRLAAKSPRLPSRPPFAKKPLMWFEGIARLLVVAGAYVELQLVASFNQRDTVLAARASEQQIKDLRAAWASMSGRTDYERINAEMTKLASTTGTKLPPPLWD